MTHLGGFFYIHKLAIETAIKILENFYLLTAFIFFHVLVVILILTIILSIADRIVHRNLKKT